MNKARATPAPRHATHALQDDGFHRSHLIQFFETCGRADEAGDYGVVGDIR
ncbi:MAG: hypothetical protein AB1508_11575 [Pseudomonadota bacterium]